MSTLSTTANNLYDLYIKSITDLAQAMVIKFDQVAKSVNKSVLLQSGVIVDEDNPQSWKYYQNICGQYHFTDVPMSVYSLDAEISIDFTVAALQANPVTKAAYAFGSTYYNDLVAAYPEQEALILGILYPADMATAIAAKDGTILSYPTHLIEEGETDFLRILQAWIYAYLHRWYNTAYCATDDLYAASALAQLTLILMGAISNIRLAACKTNQAHSFHIKQYLRSHGFLDTYLNQMTTKQALDMYRNINYYERNAGFEATFDRLIEVVMTGAGLPAYSYEMRHNQETITHSNNVDTKHLQSIGHFKRQPINSIGKRYPLPDYDLVQLNAAAATQTPYNDDYQTWHYTDVAQAMSLSKHAQLPTKVVECSINPVGTPSSLPPDRILFNHWIDWAASDRYAVPVEFIPEGSKTPVRLSHQQAVAVWAYVTHRALEPLDDPTYPKLLRVPAIQLSRVVRSPKPNVQELYDMAATPYLSTQMIDLIYSTGFIVPNTVASLAVFQQLCGQIYAANINQYKLYSFQSHPVARGHAQGAVARLYADKIVRLMDLADPEDPSMGMLYSTLIQQLGLNFSGYRPIDYYNTATSILNAATGSQNNDLRDPSNVQAAMVSLLRYLSSYSIQVISSGASDLNTTIPRPDVRVSNHKSAIAFHLKARIPIADVDNVLIQESFNKTVGLSAMPGTRYNTMVPTFRTRTETGTLPDRCLKVTSTLKHRVRTGVSVKRSFDSKLLFDALTMSQRMQVVDVYQRRR